MQGAPLLLTAAPATFALGALASLLLANRPRVANLAGPAVVLLGCTISAVVAAFGLLAPEPVAARLAWQIPFGAVILEADPLSGWFLVPVSLLGALASIYGHGYLKAYVGRKNLGAAWSAYNLLLGGMATALLARNGALFLMGWEIMSLSAWYLVSFEHERDEVRQAGWIYLVATHISIAALLVLFVLLRHTSGGSADFTEVARGAAPTSALLLLALVGFGTKAGLLPGHVWLPSAHAAAPSHVSAIMSGVVVKMGIYGILRLLLVLGRPPLWFPITMMILGLLGGLLGVASALGQRDLKRILAYSTIENIGIITLGIGVGAWGWSRGDPAVASLGFGGALLHVWNHAAMKALLFLGAGSVLHGAGTRDIEHLGGLMRRMPWTGAMLTLGAVAVAGLPPLNGFTGEWLITMGLIHGGQRGGGVGDVGMLLTVGLFSVVGALAAVCFTRLVGIVLLGSPRTAEASRAHESGPTMLGPMVVLAGLCVASGLATGPLLTMAGPVLRQFFPVPVLADSGGVSEMGLIVWAGLLLGALILLRRLRQQPSEEAETWGCGYAAPTSRMQYTGHSFAELAETHLVPAALQPQAGPGALREIFPGPLRHLVDYADATLRLVYLPLFDNWARRFAQLRTYQQGKTWFYVGYIGAVLILGLAWSALRPGPL